MSAAHWRNNVENFKEPAHGIHLNIPAPIYRKIIELQNAIRISEKRKKGPGIGAVAIECLENYFKQIGGVK